MSEIKIKISFDTSAISPEVEKAKRAIDGLTQTASNSEAKIKKSLAGGFDATPFKMLAIEVKNTLDQISTAIRKIGDLKDVVKGFGGSIAQRIDLGVDSKMFDQLEKSAVNKLKSAGEAIKDFGGKLTGLGNSLTKSLLNADGRKALEDFKTTLASVFDPFKEAALPVVTNVLKTGAFYVEKLKEAFKSLSPETKQVIGTLLGVGAAIGVALTLLGPVIAAIGGAVVSISSAVTAIGAIGSLLPVIAAVAAVIAGLVAGIGLAVGAVYALSRAWQEGVGPLASAIAIIGAAALTGIAPIIGLPVLIGTVLYTLYQIWATNFGNIRAFTMVLWGHLTDIVGSALGAVYGFVSEIGGKVVDWWNENYALILETVETINQSIKAAVESFLAAIYAFWAQHGEAITTAVKSAWQLIKSIVETGLDVIFGLTKVAMLAFNGHWDQAWQAVLDVVRVVHRDMVKLIFNAFAYIRDGAGVFGIWLLKKFGEMSLALTELVIRTVAGLVMVFFRLPELLGKIIPVMIRAGIQIGTALTKGIQEGLSNWWTGAGIAEGGLAPPDNESGIIDQLRGRKEAAIGAGIGGDLSDQARKFADLNKSVGDAGNTARTATDHHKAHGKAVKDTGDLAKKADKLLTVTSGNDIYDKLYLDAAKKYRIDPNILLEQGRRESINFRADVVSGRTKSPKGAIGIAQFMPKTAEEWGVNPYDVTSSIFGQARYMRHLLNLYRGNYSLALAAYNAGEGNVEKYGYKIPPFRETRQYVRAITTRARRTSEQSGVYYGLGNSKALTPEQISDSLTEQRDNKETLAMIESARELNIRPTDDVIKAYNRILIEEARKQGKLQPALADTAAEFKNFSELPDIGTTPIAQLDTSQIEKQLKLLDEYGKSRTSSYQEQVLRLQEENDLIGVTDDLEQQRIKNLTEIARLKQKMKDDGLLDADIERETILLKADQQKLLDLMAENKARKDQYETAKKEQEQVKQIENALADSFNRILEGFTHGFKSGLKAIWKEIKDFGNQILGTFFKELSQNLAKSLMKGLFGVNSGGAQGGGIFGGILSKIFGGGATGQQGSNGFMPGESGGVPTGIFGGQGGLIGGLLKKVPFIGKLFGGGASAAATAVPALASSGLPRALTAPFTFAPDVMSGADVGIRGSETRLASAGSGGLSLSKLGAFFTNPWTIVGIGAAIGGYFLLRAIFGDKSIKRLRAAIQQDYGVLVKDKSLLKQIKQIGEQQLGKGAAAKHPHEVIRLDDARELIRAHAEATGQDAKRIGFSKADLTNENSLANRQVAGFGGFRALGGMVRAGMAYVVGEKRPELFVPQVNGYIQPNFAFAGGWGIKRIFKWKFFKWLHPPAGKRLSVWKLQPAGQ